MQRLERLLLLHFDRVALALAGVWLVSALAEPWRRSAALDEQARTTDAQLARLAEHQRGVTTAPPSSPAEVERALAALTRAPAAPEPFPAWCTERRPWFAHEVELTQHPEPVHEAPGELTVDVGAPGRARLSWKPGPGNHLVRVAFRLERRVGEGAWEALAEPPASEYEDLDAPPGRPLLYRVISRAELLDEARQADALELAPTQVELACESSAPALVRREVELLLKDTWVPPEGREAEGWATMVVRRVGPLLAEVSRRSLPRVMVGAEVPGSGATLLEVGSRERTTRWSAMPVATPWARIRWADGQVEELEATR